MSRPLAVVLEGPDGAGKSTLAEQLTTSLGLILHHAGPPTPRGALADCTDWLDWYSEGRDEPGWEKGFVADRFHLGERVYGPVYRGVDTLGDEGQRSVEARLMSGFRALLVICLPPWHVVQSNWRATREEQMFQDEGKLLEVYERYLYLGAGPAASQLPVVRYDYTRASFTELLARLEAL